MGYNLVTRCIRCGESAFIFRGKEAEGISLWLKKHGQRGHYVEWAVDNNESTPEWADTESTYCLPDDFTSSPTERTDDGEG